VYEPNRCANKSPHDAMLELRKTCLLYKLCHAKVTHSKLFLSKFMSRFDELGYRVNKQTGFVVKGEESKKRPRHYDLVDTDDEDE
jgi:hypothetical protein